MSFEGFGHSLKRALIPHGGLPVTHLPRPSFLDARRSL